MEVKRVEVEREVVVPDTKVSCQMLRKEEDGKKKEGRKDEERRKKG